MKRDEKMRNLYGKHGKFHPPLGALLLFSFQKSKNIHTATVHNVTN